MTTKIEIEDVNVAVRTRDELVRVSAGEPSGVRLSVGIRPETARELAGQLLTCADAVDAGEDVEPCEECGELLFGETLRRDVDGIPFCAKCHAGLPTVAGAADETSVPE